MTVADLALLWSTRESGMGTGTWEPEMVAEFGRRAFVPAVFVEAEKSGNYCDEGFEWDEHLVA